MIDFDRQRSGRRNLTEQAAACVMTVTMGRAGGLMLVQPPLINVEEVCGEAAGDASPRMPRQSCGESKRHVDMGRRASRLRGRNMAVSEPGIALSISLTSKGRGRAEPCEEHGAQNCECALAATSRMTS